MNQRLESQIKKYESIKLSQSYRGIAGGLILIFSIIGCLKLVSSQGFSEETMYSLLNLAIFTPIIYFIFKGKKWAIILMMCLLTVSQLSLLVQKSFSGIILYLGFMTLLAQALEIENGRRRK